MAIVQALSPGTTGFAAQDLIDNAPFAVIENDPEKDEVLVDQTKLIPLLTKALQEVMQKNEDLEACLAALKRLISNLRQPLFFLTVAKLNFPDPTLVQTYTEAGITWTWNAVRGLSAEPGNGFDEAVADGRYLSKLTNDTAAGELRSSKILLIIESALALNHQNAA